MGQYKKITREHTLTHLIPIKLLTTPNNKYEY